MGRFINGVLVGAAIALLVAPMPGEDLRRLIRERARAGEEEKRRHAR